jgi:hypothetical protein
MAKKPKDDVAAIAAAIKAGPTRSDAQVAADATETLGEKVSAATVSGVRSEMGAKHTWKES